MHLQHHQGVAHLSYMNCTRRHRRSRHWWAAPSSFCPHAPRTQNAAAQWQPPAAAHLCVLRAGLESALFKHRLPHEVGGGHGGEPRRHHTLHGPVDQGQLQQGRLVAQVVKLGAADLLSVMGMEAACRDVRWCGVSSQRCCAAGEGDAAAHPAQHGSSRHEAGKGLMAVSRTTEFPLVCS